jgi:hypothetical protein
MQEDKPLPVAVIALRADDYSPDRKNVIISLTTKYSAAERRYSVPVECLHDLIVDLQRLNAPPAVTPASDKHQAVMEPVTPMMVLLGTLRLSDEESRQAAGEFDELFRDNAQVFKSHFGVELFPDALTVDIPTPSSLQADLDAGILAPSIIIPKAELVNTPEYLGDGQAWPCMLKGAKFPEPIVCWIFRRIGSQVPGGVIELVAKEGLKEPRGLQHGDVVTIEVFSKQS